MRYHNCQQNYKGLPKCNKIVKVLSVKKEKSLNHSEQQNKSITHTVHGHLRRESADTQDTIQQGK